MSQSEPLKERVEFSLEPRQIFSVFIVSAVVLSLVFALGVLVGKRMATLTPVGPTTDPLAILDQLAERDHVEDLSFPRTLGQQKGPRSPAPSPVPVQPPVALEQPAAPPPVAAAAARPVETGGADTPSPPPTQEAAVPNVGAATADRAPSTVRSPTDRQKAPEAPLPGSYLLQLSSFQDKAEADEFVRRLRDDGLKPQLIVAEIAEKGIWYRVRLGGYATFEEAAQAKTGIEQKHKIITYVIRNR